MDTLEKIKNLAMPVISKEATDEEIANELGWRMNEIQELCEQGINIEKAKEDAFGMEIMTMRRKEIAEQLEKLGSETDCHFSPEDGCAHCEEVEKLREELHAIA